MNEFAALGHLPVLGGLARPCGHRWRLGTSITPVSSNVASTGLQLGYPPALPHSSHNRADVRRVAAGSVRTKGHAAAAAAARPIKSKSAGTIKSAMGSNGLIPSSDARNDTARPLAPMTPTTSAPSRIRAIQRTDQSSMYCPELSGHRADTELHTEACVARTWIAVEDCAA